MPLPKESTPKANRWEGTHLYNRSAGRKRPRTVADLREEAAARRESDREKRLSEARGPAASEQTPSTSTSTPTPTPSTTTPPLPLTGTIDPEPQQQQQQQQQQQSGMPGSSKKKRNSSGRDKDAAGDQDDQHEPNPTGTGIDPALRSFLLSIKTDINQSTNEAIGRIDKRIEKTEEGIKELRAKMEEQDKLIDTKIQREVAKLGATNATQPPLSGPRKDMAIKREEAYFRCRRTLKIWPIEGEDLADATRVFFANRLGMAADRIRALGELSVALSPGRAAKLRKELLVTFESIDDRDAVKAMGSNLAGQSEAGMSVHVPGHLLDSLYALNGVGYSIKAKNQGVKRSIKFDDLEQNIYLDICIAGQWKKITPTEAKNALKKLPTSSASMVSNTLSGDDISSLIQGDVVAGLTAVIVPEESETS